MKNFHYKLIIFISVIQFVDLNFTEAQVTQEWVARYNNVYDYSDKAHVVRAGEAGNIYVCGETSSPGIKYSFIILKYDSLGNFLNWLRATTALYQILLKPQ